MNADNPKHAAIALDQLIDSVLDGQATVEQQQSLSAMLRCTPGALDLAAARLLWHAELAEAVRPSPVKLILEGPAAIENRPATNHVCLDRSGDRPSNGERLAPRVSQGPPRRLPWLIGGAIAACLAVAAAASFGWRVKPSSLPLVRCADGQERSVAQARAKGLGDPAGCRTLLVRIK